jgi:hypothetical protein
LQNGLLSLSLKYQLDTSGTAGWTRTTDLLIHSLTV